MSLRTILHCDLNNFYASVECLHRPELRGSPLAVCGSQSTRHGIVLAKNNLAKSMGVKTADTIWQARAKCPQLVVVQPNYSLYLKFSIYAREIYQDYSNLIESFGIDECWLDVTDASSLFGTGEQIAHTIRQRVKEELGVTVSIGVSFNKIFAKLGSDLKKPDAVTVISADSFKDKLWSLPSSELLYVGRSTDAKLKKLGICTIGDLACTPLKFLSKHLGKWGETLWGFANGMDSSPVTAMDFESTIKGVGNSLTTPRDLTNDEDVRILVYVLAESVGERLRHHRLKGKTVQVFIKDPELSYIERQGQLGFYSYTTSDIARKALDIFRSCWDWTKSIRAIGIRVTDLIVADGNMQLSLFLDHKHVKQESLDYCVDNLRKRFGHYCVQRGLLLKDNSLNSNPVEENIIHPVSYFRN